jgi:hypothetical protein
MLVMMAGWEMKDWLTNCSPTSSDVIRPVVAELGDNNSDRDHTGTHDNRTNQKKRLATNAINDQL